MAATLSPQISQTNIQDSLAHSRNLSSVSSVTLLTSHSQPTEPLLSTPTSAKKTPQYVVHHRSGRPQSHYSSRNDPRQLSPHDADPSNQHPANGRDADWGSSQSRSARRRSWAVPGLESIILGWAFYNSIRYFLSFRLYDKSAPQAYAFALGACTGTSVALAICRFAMGFITFRPQRARVDLVGPVLAYLSSFLLLIPAIVNLVLVTSTKRSNDLQFNVLHRCRLDVDVVWSVTRRICEPPESRWPAWAVLAAVRLVVTLFLLIGYHTLSRTRPCLHCPRHLRLDSTSVGPSTGLLSPSETPARARSMETAYADPTHRPPSRSSLSVVSRPESASFHSPPRPIRLARSQSSGLSGETVTMAGDSSTLETLHEAEHDTSATSDVHGFVGRFQSLVAQIQQETDAALDLARSDRSLSPEDSIGADGQLRLHGPPRRSHDEFRLDEAGHYGSSYYDLDQDDEDEPHGAAGRSWITQRSGNISPENGFNLRPTGGPTAFRPTLGYNEFGLPYPPDENVRVMQGLVKKMPTIESMGSGEMTSIAGMSMHRPGNSLHSASWSFHENVPSRPPTRNTLLSMASGTGYESSGSRPSSRASAVGGLAMGGTGTGNGNGNGSVGTRTRSVGGASELGELVLREEVNPKRFSSPLGYHTEHTHGGAGGYSDGTADSGTGTTLSYHTATMNSSGSGL